MRATPRKTSDEASAKTVLSGNFMDNSSNNNNNGRNNIKFDPPIFSMSGAISTGVSCKMLPMSPNVPLLSCDKEPCCSPCATAAMLENTHKNKKVTGTDILGYALCNWSRRAPLNYRPEVCHRYTAKIFPAERKLVAKLVRESQPPPKSDKPCVRNIFRMHATLETQALAWQKLIV